MAQRKIVIHQKAENAFNKVVAWYCMNCGYSFAATFIENTNHTYDILASMPSVGKVVKHTGKRCYAEFVSHPLTIIRYWFDDEELHIVQLIFTRMSKV